MKQGVDCRPAAGKMREIGSGRSSNRQSPVGPMSSDSFDIYLLGGFRIARDGRTLPLPATRKALVLMAYLAMLEGRAVAREKLAGLLWSDRSEAQARGSLRQALTSLKRLYGNILETEGNQVALPQRSVAVDALRLVAAVDADDPVQATNAALLYQGTFLAGYDAPDRGAEDWLHAERERIRRAALVLVERLAATASYNPAAREPAFQLAGKLVIEDPATEEAHRALIRLALAEGRTTSALRQYEACCEALQRSLGAAPEAETRALMEQVRQASLEVAGASPAASPAPGDTAESRQGPSIVVLPFDNLAGADDAFVDGIVEEITGALARMRGLFVIARQSAYAFKGQAIDVREVGARLGVRYALEGSVRRAGDRVRIATQLIDAETGLHLWADRFEGQLGDVFDFQDMIAERVAGALHPSLRSAEIERARKKPPEVLQAYDLVMRAYPHFWAHTASDNAEAMALLKQATDADPQYGLALALLAWCHAQEAVYLWSKDPTESHQTALRFARRAALLVDDDATALTAIGAAESMSSGDLKLAGSFIERALRIDPNHAWAWLRSGWLNVFGDRFDAAIGDFERALALSPLDPFAFNAFIGMAFCYSAKGDHESAMRLIEMGIHARPGMAWAYRGLAVFAARAGDIKRAQQAASTFLAAHPGMTISRMRQGMPKPIRGNEGFWENLRRAGIPER